jgi:hypothetical protein
MSTELERANTRFAPTQEKAGTKQTKKKKSEEEMKVLRRCVHRGTPFGSPTWIARIAHRLGLENTLQPQGRPKKKGKK